MLMAAPVAAKPAENAPHESHPAAAHAAPAPRPPAPHAVPGAAIHRTTQRARMHDARDARDLPRGADSAPVDEARGRDEAASDRLNAYRSTLNDDLAAHPGTDHGYWSNGWYHGYWHEYWNREAWISWHGHYGFWLTFNGLDAFVYEYTPGVCSYWDGTEWVPWWNPPYTPYHCPF